MKVTLESTTKIIEVRGTQVRIWEGVTENGIPCYAAIALIAHHKDDDHRNEEFVRDLAEQKEPSERAIQAFDPRFVI